jgi:hypothetical protein
MSKTTTATEANSREPATTRPACERCTFWTLDPVLQPAGRCRRQPPIPSFPSGYGVFPVLLPNEVCGEFRGKTP